MGIPGTGRVLHGQYAFRIAGGSLDPVSPAESEESHRMHRKLIVAAALAAVAVAGAVPAVADTAQARVVSDNPVDFTPQVSAARPRS